MSDNAFDAGGAQAYPQTSQAYGNPKPSQGTQVAETENNFPVQVLGARILQLKQQISNWPHPNSDYVRQRQTEINRHLDKLKLFSDE